MAPGRLRRDPPAYPGMRIGLFGGSFDPAHAGHRHVAETARRALGLHKVWWLVTPQNPLKPRSSPLAERLSSARTLARRTGHVVTAIETRLGLRYSVDTVTALQTRYPGVRFVWVVGGDAMETFHRWRRWKQIFTLIPVAVVARERIAAHGLRGRAFSRFAADRIRAPRRLPVSAPPAWIYLAGRLSPESSTRLRAQLQASGAGDSVLRSEGQ